MTFTQKLFPENRSKSPEPQHLTAEASDIFTNTLRPQMYNAAANLQRIVREVVAPEAFQTSEPAPGLVEALAGTAGVQPEGYRDAA